MAAMNRRILLNGLLGLVAGLVLERGSAQQSLEFDPVAMARLRAGEVVREISQSARETSVPEPPRDAVFNTGLLLQAGLRALLPVNERKDVALPGSASPNDPKELIEAQENYKAVFASGADASPVQKMTALRAIELASRQLSTEGYWLFSKAVSDWLMQQNAR
jgi:hypothetical protein